MISPCLTYSYVHIHVSTEAGHNKVNKIALHDFYSVPEVCIFPHVLQLDLSWLIKDVLLTFNDVPPLVQYRTRGESNRDQGLRTLIIRYIDFFYYSL